MSSSAFDEKWKNFWYHYKSAAIIIAIGIVFLIMLTYNLMSYPSYDMTVSIICDTQNPQFRDGIKNDFLSVVSDADKNGKNEVHTIFISTSNPDQNRLTEVGMIQSSYLELVQNETYLVFAEPRMVDNYANINGFTDLSDIISDFDIPRDALYTLNDKVFGIDVTKLAYGKVKGLSDETPLYMSIMYEKDKSERSLQERQNAFAVLSEICKYK